MSAAAHRIALMTIMVATHILTDLRTTLTEDDKLSLFIRLSARSILMGFRILLDDTC
jgi:hypothetical protein